MKVLVKNKQIFKLNIHLFYGENISAKAIIAAYMRLKPDRIFLAELYFSPVEQLKAQKQAA